MNTEKKDAVLSIKTTSRVKALVRRIAQVENRSLAGQVQLFLGEAIRLWEAQHGKLGQESPG